MPTAEWTLDLARRWATPTRVRSPRWGLVAATAAAVAVTGVTSRGASCAAYEPTFCVQDPVLPAAIGLLVASAALLWWQPWVAATCVAGFTILVRVVYPNATGPVIAGVLLLVMHLLHLLVLRREAADRLASAARAVVPVPAGWCGIGRVSTVGRFPVPFAAPIALALLSVVSFVVLVRALMADRADLVAEAVLEAPERTWWGLFAAGCLAGSLLLARPVITHRRRLALAERPPASGLPVRYTAPDVHEDDDVDRDVPMALVLPRQDVVFAGLKVSPSAEGRPEDRAPSEHLSSGVLVGELRPGGWCALATPDGLLLPTRQLEGVSTFPGTDVLDVPVDPFVKDESREPLDRLRLWHEPDVEAPTAQLPIVLSLNGPQRAGGVVIAVLALAGAWGAIHYVAGDPSLVVPIGLCLLMFVCAIGLSGSTVRLDQEEYVQATPFRRDVVPLTSVVAVRHREDSVALVTKAGDIRFLGPFDDGGSNTLSHGLPPGTTTAGVAAAVELARRGAAARPARADPRRIPSGFAWVALGVVVLVARVLTRYVL